MGNKTELTIQNVKRGQLIVFHASVTRNLTAGSKWRVTIEAAVKTKGNLLMTKMGKRGKPLSYINAPGNLQSLTPNEFSELLKKGYITVEEGSHV